MGKHFLATISNETENLYGIRFICSFFTKLPDIQVTLLHICRVESQSSCKPISTMWDGPEGKNNVDISATTRKSISMAQKMLRSRNVPVDQVKIKTVPEHYGKIKDILNESSKGLYDAIVLGRRVSYSLQWMFERAADITFQNMIKDSNCATPLWICPDLEPSRKNVLLCIDGSENCYRAVDHVGYILAGETKHSITLFHVERTVGTKCVEFFKKAEDILLNHDISAKKILRKITWGASVSSTIQKEIKKGEYAVVAIGMRGQNTKNPSNLTLSGKTTEKLISRIEKTSIWCCP